MNIYEDYYKVRHQLDALKIEEERLRELVLAEALKTKEPTIKTKFGNFTKRVTRKFVYSLDFMVAAGNVEKQIREFGKPFQEQIDAYATPLREKVEEMKKREIYEGKAHEEVITGFAFTYADNPAGQGRIKNEG